MSTFIREVRPLLDTSPIPGPEGVKAKRRSNPMHPSRQNPDPSRLNLAPRCGAKTRRGSSCQSPAVNGRKRCRMHGGAKGSGAPKGQTNGNYQHGGFTCEAIEQRVALVQLIREAKAML